MVTTPVAAERAEIESVSSLKPEFQPAAVAEVPKASRDVESPLPRRQVSSMHDLAVQFGAQVESFFRPRQTKCLHFAAVSARSPRTAPAFVV